MSERELVHVDLSDHVLTITMDRPEARNALSRQMMAELTAAYRRLDEDGDAWVGVIQAEGTSFCAGADLKEALAARSAAREDKPAAERPADSAPRRATAPAIMQRRGKPLIACVEGQAFAGGLEMVLTCDMVVASTESRFALFEVKRGLLAVGGGLFRLPRRIPQNIAMEMLLTGVEKSAQTMHELGLVNRLAEPGEVRAAARQLALEITANSPVAVQAALEVANRAADEGWQDEDGWQGQVEAFKRVQASEDLVEGLRAFSEKRPAQWKGR
ncbi:MAG: enoyl-CoA hydratase-related protein [Ilumatobacteraceae bacterium]